MLGGQPALNGQFADMIQLPFWNGDPKTPFPEVQLLADFYGTDIGDFVFTLWWSVAEDERRS